MHGAHLAILIAVFFFTSAISVVTGSTSLITVPAMLYFGIEPRSALATNMFALTFLSLGASMPLRKSNLIDRHRLPLLAGLTLAGSVLGAILLLVVPTHSLKLIVPCAMIGVAIFSTVYRKAGSDEMVISPTRHREVIGYVFTFLLGIYGGFFSGGYVTILTALFLATFRSSFREAIAMTKVLNIFSSAVATAIFMSQGLVDYKLGSVLAVTMFVGAALGGKIVVRLADRWIRRIFLTAVWILALKALVMDLFGSKPAPGHAEPVSH